MMQKSMVFTPRKTLSLEEYYKKKDSILFIRKAGGLGDVLMMRMIFEDIKKKYPAMKIIWAIPNAYHHIPKHKYVDQIIDSEKIDYDLYPYYWDLSEACSLHEWNPNNKIKLHRSDIWAQHCGIELENHNMHLEIETNNYPKSFDSIQKAKIFPNGKTIIFAPYSAQGLKSFNTQQVLAVYNWCTARNINCIILHNRAELDVLNNKIPIVLNLNTGEVIAAVKMADGVVATDTGILHAAGGIGKPTLGVFSYVSGETYTKYYKNIILLQKTGPGTDLPDCPCWNYANCHVTKKPEKPCMTNINISDLESKLEELLKRI